MQYDRILEFMEDEKEYGIWDFCELLGLKESRTKDILKGLSDKIEIIGSNRDRRYRKKQICLHVSCVQVLNNRLLNLKPDYSDRNPIIKNEN